MASLLRNAAVRRSALCCAGPSNASLPVATFATSTRSLIADNKTDATPARVHRSTSEASVEGQGKTQREAIASAMGVLDTLARDVASPPPRPTSTESVSTPSSPGLEAVYDTTGPVYTPSTLPPRTDATLEFLTNLLMKAGKKAQAQRFTTRTMSILATVTNSNPLPLVHDAIERTAPLVKLQSKKQGGKSLQVPVALTQRQSTRKALTWIIEASKKRPDREIEKRLAAEFLAVIEGTSSAIAKKEEQHRMATVNRANAAVRI